MQVYFTCSLGATIFPAKSFLYLTDVLAAAPGQAGVHWALLPGGREFLEGDLVPHEARRRGEHSATFSRTRKCFNK